MAHLCGARFVGGGHVARMQRKGGGVAAVQQQQEGRQSPVLPSPLLNQPAALTRLTGPQSVGCRSGRLRAVQSSAHGRCAASRRLPAAVHPRPSPRLLLGQARWPLCPAGCWVGHGWVAARIVNTTGWIAVRRTGTKRAKWTCKARRAQLHMALLPLPWLRMACSSPAASITVARHRCWGRRDGSQRCQH